MKANSVFWRVGIAFAVLIAITVGVGLLGVSRMSIMNAEMNELLVRRYAILKTSHEALNYSSLNNRITMQVFLIDDRKEIDRLLVERAQNSERIRILIQEIKARLDSDQERRLLADLTEKRVPYIESYKHALELLVKENKFEEARTTLIEDALPRLLKYHAAWQAFVNFQTTLASQADIQAKEVFHSARKLLIWLVVTAVLLAGVIALFTSRAIGKEMHARQKIQNSLREAGEQLEARVEQRTLELSKLNRDLMDEIGQRKQVEAALRESETKFRSIFESSNDAILLLSGKGFCDCNLRALQMFGFKDKEDFLHLGPAELSPPVQPDGKDSSAAANRHTQVAYKQGFDRFEWRHRRSDGGEFPTEVLLSSFEFCGELLIHATVRDITERKQMEMTLAQERDRFQNLMDFMPDAIYFKDREGRFTLINKAFANWLGLACPTDVLGKTDFDLFGKVHSQQAFDNEQQLMATGQPIIDLEEREDRRDGSVTWVSSTKVPLRDASGQITGLVGISRNITERKRADEAFLEAALKYQNLIESVSDWVWEADASLQYVYSNPKIKNVLGYEINQVVGQSVGDLMPGVEQCRVKTLFKDVVQEGRHEIIFDCLCLHKNGDAVMLEMNVGVIFDTAGQARGFRGVARDVTERRRLEEELRNLTRALDQSSASVVVTDTQGRIEYVNARFCKITGYTAQELYGKNPRILKSGTTPKAVYLQMWNVITHGCEWRGELCNRKKNGDLFWESAVISPIKNDKGTVTHYLGVKEDITEQKRLGKEREIMELQLRQAQKLESVGQLAAGIAHEINTPIQYVGDNLRFIQESFAALHKLILGYEEMTAKIPAGTLEASSMTTIEAVKSENDISYLTSEVPTAIQQSLDGVKRVADIVRAMKEFSHPGGKEKISVNINQAIQTTITVARNEWKYVAKVVTELDPNLPMVPCFPDEFNQVILNLLVNAAHAIGDVVKKEGGGLGTITIVTKQNGQWIEIRVSDTGTGIPEEIRHRIFELFFTTKEVGKGTGQGLALARQAIVKKHGGELTFESISGQGTTFIIRLPAASENKLS